MALVKSSHGRGVRKDGHMELIEVGALGRMSKSFDLGEQEFCILRGSKNYFFASTSVDFVGRQSGNEFFSRCRSFAGCRVEELLSDPLYCGRGLGFRRLDFFVASSSMSLRYLDR
jgi:hypothetical protein